jgi:hypothetical protein
MDNDMIRDLEDRINAKNLMIKFWKESADEWKISAEFWGEKYFQIKEKYTKIAKIREEKNNG